MHPSRALSIVLLFFALLSLHAQPNAPNPRQWEWRFVAGGASVGPGAFASDGTFYFASDDRYLYALDRNGTMIWRTDLGRRPAGSVAVGVDGTVLVTLENGEIIALNPDGRLIWRERLTSGRGFAPVVLGSGVVVTVNRPSILEARTHFGRLIWRLDLGVPVSAAPILAGDGNLLAASTRGDLFLVSVDGRLIGQRYIGENASILAANDAGTLIGSTSGRVIQIDPRLEPLWRVDVGSAVGGLFVAVNGDIYSTSDDGSLSRVTERGELAWRAQPGSPVRDALAGDELLIGSGEGLLTRLGSDGAARWQMRLPDRPLSIAAAPYAMIVVATESWVTYAYAADFSPEGSWPVARGAGDRRGVARGADGGRVDLDAFSGSARYLALRARLLSGGASEQTVAMADVAERVRSGESLAGSHQYLLQLSESVAGSPYFGPLTQFGPESAPRRAREDAVWVLGQIGDLSTVRFLARLLGYEPDTTMQAEILRSMANLGAPIDEDLAARLDQIVRRDIARGPSDGLGLAVARFVAAIDEYRGGYLHPRVTESLLAVAGANYSREVRAYALETLRELAGGRAR
ncbi:MAG: PQQ-binding-like beta-propeller repeat protein [Spirochaetota bacterium]